MASRLRNGAALLGATALLSMSTLAASADVIVEPGDDKDRKAGYEITLVPKVGNETGKDKYGTALIPLKVKENGETTKAFAYCVELPTLLEKNKGLKEAPWGDHPNPASKFKNKENAGKVLWILHNSFPALDTNKMNEKYEGNYDEQEVIAATQAAIWHFSDGVELLGSKGSKQAQDDVAKLYKKLIGQAQVLTEPTKPTLEIAPASKSGKAGEKIGPFTVTTTATELKLTAELPDGVTITDAEGKPLNVEKKAGKAELTAKAEGDKVSEFFVNVPAKADKGEAKMNVSAEATLPKGRLFIAEDARHKTQSLVIAQDSKVKVDKDATANWTANVQPSEPTTPSSTSPSSSTPSTTPPTTTTSPAAPAPGGGEDLASTGASILWPLLGGLVLVGAGVGALFVVRRKKAGA